MAAASKAPTLPAPPASVLEELGPGLLVAERYRLEEQLGRGAMGVVFSAHDASRDERVALKFLLLDDDAQHFRSRFAREARICAKLSSEHIVKVLDFGAYRGSLAFIAMERLEGHDLRAVLRQQSGGRMSVEEAIATVVQICEGLAEVHAKGVVHRDLKPSNVFRSHDGVIKILDFGISKSFAPQELTVETELTDTGAVLGTPRFMAPEQLFGGRVDARADVWSVGAILYELLTGKTPFDAATLPLLCARLTIDEPPSTPSALRPELPRAIDAVVLGCLERLIERRTQNVAELAGDLLAAIGAPNAEAVRDRLLTKLSAERAVRVAPARRWRGPIIALATGALLVATIPILLRRAKAPVAVQAAGPPSVSAIASAAPSPVASAVASAVTSASASAPRPVIVRPTIKPTVSAKPSLSTLIGDRQ
jgi:serine/threonine-protein kinase